MSKEKTTVETTKRGIPVLFLAGAVIAYFNMPEHADTVTKLVGSVGVGVGTSVGAPIGMLCGGALGAIFGIAAGWKKDIEAGLAIGGIAGLILGIPGGIYMGYHFVKDIVDDHINSHPKIEHHDKTYSAIEAFEDRTIQTPSGQKLQLKFG